MTPRLTVDIDEPFVPLFLAGCAKLGCKPIDLLRVIFSESGGKASAYNPNGGASGLIQFMPDTLKWLGWTDTPQHFRMLPASQQVRFIVAYLSSFSKAAGTWDSAARIYQAIFLPGTLDKARYLDDVIAARGGPLGWAYDANCVFDTNGDLKITLRELDASARRAARSARFSEMLERLGIDDEEEATHLPDPFDVDSASDVQRALNTLIPDAKLAVDGIAGPATRAAVRAFQEQTGLHADGIAGPNTRAALRAALERSTGPQKETGHDGE